MRKTKNHPKKNKPQRNRTPQMPWQTGDYARDARFSFMLPIPFLLLCKLVNVTPEQILLDFMDNLSFGSWKREGRDEARALLADYFIAYGYGQPKFSTDDLRSIFKELDALGMIWPVNAPMELIELTGKWREEFYTYWFDKWRK